MRSTSVLSFLGVLVASLVTPFTALHAAEIRSGDKVHIKTDETIKDDLYAFGQEIIIDGTVEGDVIAFGKNITVNGKVDGNIMAAGETVEVTGEANGARIAGKVLRLAPKSKLDGDLLAAGLSLECAKESQISGDFLFAGYQALLAGQISDDVRGGMANCRLEGIIGGDVNVEVGNDKKAVPPSAFGPASDLKMPTIPGGLTVGDSAQVEGDVTYHSSLEASIDDGAKINGEVQQRKPAPKAKKNGAAAPPANPFAAKTVGRLKHIACVALVGFLVLVIFPRWTTAVADTIRTRPGAAFLSGLIGFAAFVAFVVLTLIVVIVAAVFLAGIQLTDLVPIVVVGGIVGYAAVIVGFWMLYSFLAQAIAGLAIGRAALREPGFGTRLLALLLGVVLIGLILSVPIVGGLLGFAILIFALGSVCLWFIGQTPAQSFLPLPAEKPLPAAVV